MIDDLGKSVAFETELDRMSFAIETWRQLVLEA
jgi:hypothetical protein